MSASRFFRYLGTGLLSALLLVVSFPFTGGLTWLIFIAWVPLLWVASELRETKRGWLWLFLIAYISFLLFNIGTTWWIWNSTSMGALLAFGCNSLLMALTLTLGFIWFKKKSLFFFLLGIGLCWLSFEYIHFQWEISWPWLTLGNFFSIRTRWVQWYEFTGALGGSLWVIAVNAMVLYHIKQKSDRRFVLKTLGGVVFAPLALSYVLYFLPGESVSPKDAQPVAILQPNIDPYHEKFTMEPTQQLAEMLELVGTGLPKNALILGPETALQESFTEDNFGATASYGALKKNIIDEQHSLLIGASTFKIFKQKNSVASRKNDYGTFEESYNTSLLFTPQSLEFAHKSKLVPGVEKIPFAGIFPFLEAVAIENGGTSGTLGVEKEPQVFTLQQKKIAPVICYESIYGGFVATQCRKGANLIAIITNDGWWGETPGHRQHNSFAALRAIENRRFVIRSGNTGISSVWSPKGDCSAHTKYNEKTSLRATVSFTDRKTLYTLLGDYIGVLSILCLLGWFLTDRFRARK